MTPQERLDKLELIIRQAHAACHSDVIAEAVDILTRLAAAGMAT